ncbi:MAG TPA: TIGR02281 family clan AA aspartic protease [Sphingomicrobium sp.]|jgi:aspartyl protease family protein|nr:TIGR02281 family clan AA aspartic protease [Sphingomicrobium sp.]
MLRTYIFVALLVGFAVAMFGRDLHTGAPQPNGTTVAVHSEDVAESAPVQSRAGSQSINALDQEIELTRDSNGYFYADVQINGAPVHMVVDTGATVIALSRDDARAAGIATSIGMNDVVGQGADGVVKGEQVSLDRVTLGGKTVEGVPAVVLSSGGQSLLGQSFLDKFASVKIEGDKMVLR